MRSPIRNAYCLIIMVNLLILPSIVLGEAVQWQIEDGGNGHWYDSVVYTSNWDEAKAHAESQMYSGMPGHLVTITSKEEQDFVWSHFPYNFWLGGYQDDKSSEPHGNWIWVTGEKWSYTNWRDGEPNNLGGAEDCLEFYGGDPNGKWSDFYRTSINNGYIIEYETKPEVPTETGWSYPLPDTGQTKCYNEYANETPCPEPGEAFYGQDGNYLINPPSYTKLDSIGNDLPLTAKKWAMVRDNMTGLIWEVKTDDGSIHDRDKKYEWQNANDVFIAQLNAENFGGHSDWRLPTIQELSSITSLGQDDPAINAAYFPYTVSFDYWSSDDKSGSDFAWSVYFKHGGSYWHGKAGCYEHVRAVRGGQAGSLDHFVINGDGTVTDTNTGLMWQQTTAGPVKWQSALSECEGLSLGGYKDWRLPNLRALRSIIDYSKYDPTVTEKYFPNTVSSYYWSSTPYTYYPYGSWRVHFGSGDDSWTYNFDGGYARAVRGGQNQLSGHLLILSPAQASTWKVGNKMPIRWNTSGVGGNVKISLSTQGGKDGTFQTIIDSTPNDGSYDWKIDVAASVNCVLKLEPLSDSAKGTSQGLFTLEELEVPSDPKLLLSISGSQVSISWSRVENANGYIFSYAPAPYSGVQSIRTIDMADQTTLSVELWNGAAFFVAVQAYNDAGISEYSNIVYFKID